MSERPIDLAELERLARAAQRDVPMWRSGFVPVGVMRESTLIFMGAASPDVVLRLVAALRVAATWEHPDWMTVEYGITDSGAEELKP